MSSDVVNGPLYSIVAGTDSLLNYPEREFKEELEGAWAKFLGWPPEYVRLDLHAWDYYQHSPRYWDGIVAGEYMNNLLIEGARDGSARFLGIQTMRTLVNHDLASRLGIPYLAASLRSPVQSLLIRKSHERQLVLDRLIQQLSPPYSKASDLSDVPYSIEYSAPFILALALERMREPDDYWKVIADYRKRFRPLRERLRRDREKWDGRAGPYVRRMLRRIRPSDFLEQAGQATIDSSAVLVAGALGGIAGPSASLAMKLLMLLNPAERVQMCYRRWFRPELYLLASLRDEAEQLRALDGRVQNIWKCRWGEEEYMELDLLRATNPAPFLRLGTI